MARDETLSYVETYVSLEFRGPYIYMTEQAVSDRLTAVLENLGGENGCDDDIYAAGAVVLRALAADNARLRAVQKMPTMKKARTRVTGSDGYTMVFRFHSIEALHAADDEWVALRKSDAVAR